MQAYREKCVMFLAGFGMACLLALSVGAAQRPLHQPNRYDASVGGLAPLQIVDHQSNTLYLYNAAGKNTYALGGTLDLTRTGQAEIQWENTGDEGGPGQ